jgi:alpha-D-ribose 1-methylphosphonate 5-triphosphate synthase subunit PhnH
VEAEALGAGAALTLEGPGIDGRRTLAVAGLDARFTALLDANRATAPLGLDVILTAGDALAALPRSVRLVR